MNKSFGTLALGMKATPLCSSSNKR